MRRPEPADTVRAAVKDVIEKIVSHKAQDPAPPRERNGHDAELVKPDEQAVDECAEDQARNAAAQAKAQRGERIAGFIFFPRAVSGPDHFGQDQQDENGDGEIDRVGQLIHVADAAGQRPDVAPVRRG